jgi:hypothetical protein
MRRLSLIMVALVAAFAFSPIAAVADQTPGLVIDPATPAISSQNAGPVTVPNVTVPPGYVLVPAAPQAAAPPAPKSFFDKPLVIDSSRVDGGTQVQTVSLGSWAASILEWIATIAAGPLSIIITAWFYQLIKKMGLDNQEKLRGRFQEIVENGLALAAHDAGVKLNGTMPVQIRGQIANQTLDYVKAHGADTIKALGGATLNDPKAEEAALARIAKALSDKIDPPTGSVTVTAPSSSTVAADVTPAPPVVPDPMPSQPPVSVRPVA